MSYKENVIHFKGPFPLAAGSATPPVGVAGYLSAQLALNGSNDLVVECQGVIVRQPSSIYPKEEDWLTKRVLTGKGFFDLTSLPSLMRLRVVTGTLTSAVLDASPDASLGAVSVDAGSVTTPPVVTPPPVVSGLPPKGTGGTPGKMVTRVGTGAAYQTLTSNSPLNEFAAGRVAFMGNDGPIYPGSTGDVTNLGLVGGKEYRLGTTGSLVEVPNPIPAGYPDSTLLSATVRYYDGLNTYESDGKMYLYHDPTALVRVPATDPQPVDPPVTPPVTETKVDWANIPYATNLEGQGINLMFRYAAGANNTTLAADGDVGQTAGAAPSTRMRTIGGVSKGVYLTERNYGADALRRLTAATPELGGDLLIRFQMSIFDWNQCVPGVFIGANGTEAAGSVYEITLTGASSGGKISYKLKETVFASGTPTSTDVAGASGSSTINRLENTWYMVRVRVDAATKKVSLRVWLDSEAEPSTWLIDGVVAANLVAGHRGYRSKEGKMEVNLFKITPNGVVASVS